MSLKLSEINQATRIEWILTHRYLILTIGIGRRNGMKEMLQQFEQKVELEQE